MKQYTWTTLATVILIAFCNLSESKSISKRQVHVEAGITADGHNAVETNAVWRDKQKVEAKFGIKNALLGFVFNPTSVSSFIVTTKRPTTTTEDVVIYEKNQPVSIDVPSELIGSGYTLLTNISTRIGDLMINSALRTHRLLESMRPFIWKIFGKKGLVIEATTDKPIFTDPNEKPST